MPTRPKRLSSFGAARARTHIQSKFNPIRGLTPARLANYLDAFDQGHLRLAVETWQKITERDDQVMACCTKRSRQASLLNWEILPIDDSSEALLHKQILEDFYNDLSATNVLDEDSRGGVRFLVDQMLTAVGMRWAVHEIVWRPRATGLSAQFRFVPLQFFEHFTSRLRFLENDFDLYGVDMEPGNWLVTSGDGLMRATSVAYMFKSMPLKAWVTYVEKYGIPGLHAKTDAAPDSPEWNAMAEALAGFGEDLAILTSMQAEITTLSGNVGTSTLPQPPLVDRMDRAISRIWMGGDLATMSTEGASVGAMPQSDDLAKIEQADAALVSDALQQQVDPWVIKYRTGAEKPKAYFKLIPKSRSATDIELRVDEFLMKAGARLGKKDLLERYGRAEPDAGDELVAGREADGQIRAAGTPRLADRSALVAHSIGNEKVETVSGVVPDLLGRPPKVGDRVKWRGAKLEVTSMIGPTGLLGEGKGTVPAAGLVSPPWRQT